MNKPCPDCRTIVLGNGCPTCQADKKRIAELELIVENLKCCENCKHYEYDFTCCGYCIHPNRKNCLDHSLWE